MNSIYLTYSKFCCRIQYMESYDYCIQKLKSDYSDYYNFTYYSMNHCMEIHIFDKLKPLINYDFEEVVSIHSSHSKNRKYYLNGRIWEQKDANIIATKREMNGIREYSISQKDTIIQIQQCQVTICGSDPYDELAYIVESAMYTYFENVLGGIALHAASCVDRGKATIICARSGAGKTTLLFDMIKAHEYEFHANDRVILYELDSKIYVISMPIPVNMPIKIMRKYSIQDDNPVVKKAERDSKIRFRVNQLNLLSNKIFYKDAIINRIFVPDYDANKENSISKLIDTEMLEELDILSPFDSCHPDWLEIFPKLQRSKSIKEQLREWLCNIDCYKITGNNLIVSVQKEVL